MGQPRYCHCRPLHETGTRLNGQLAHISRCPVCGLASYTAAIEHGQTRRRCGLPYERFDSGVLDDLRRAIEQVAAVGRDLEMPRPPRELGPRRASEWAAAARVWVRLQAEGARREVAAFRRLEEQVRVYARPARRLGMRLDEAIVDAECRIDEYRERAFARIAELESKLGAHPSAW